MPFRVGETRSQTDALALDALHAYYKIDTLIDTYTLLPQQGSIPSQEGSRRRLRTTRFDRAANRAFFERQLTVGSFVLALREAR